MAKIAGIIAIFLLIYGCTGEKTIKMTNKNEETKEGKNMKTLEIKWQRLVSAGQTCPRCKSTEEELAKAISTLEQSLASLNIQVVLEKNELSVAEFKKNLLQSNQIWLNGQLLENWIDGKIGQSPCCDICGPSECRTTIIGGEIYEVIPADLIIKAGLLAASNLVGTKTNESYRKNKAPKIPTTKCCPK